jgi:hypothetical protein
MPHTYSCVMMLTCWDYSVREQRLHIFFEVVGVMAHLPSLMPRHARRISIVDVWARSPCAVRGELNGLDGKKVEAPCIPRTISGMGSKWSLQFFSKI